MADTMGEVITIENFQAKMPQIPVVEPNNTLYGLVDMGSNGIRFSITDLSPDISRLLRCIYRERAGISLYAALHESTPNSTPFHFSQNTIAAVADTLGRFRGICDQYGVKKGNIQVFATEAMRTSKNREEMLQAIKEASGLTVDILSPAMESLFGALGARSGYERVDGLFMDLGGGSVQLTYVNSTSSPEYYTLAAEAAKSMPYGAARLTEALSVQSTADAAKTDLKRGMKDTFDGLKIRFPRLREQSEQADGITIYFCGGGFRGYGSMLMHTDPIQPYPIPAIGGYTVPGHRFIQWRDMLKVNDYDGKIFGMSKQRREQFPAIVTVVRALVETVPKIKEVIFCSGGNREGVLYMRLSPDVRENNPLTLLPGGVPGMGNAVVASIRSTILDAIPKVTPRVSELPQHLFQYLAKNMYLHIGRADDANSAKALHRPISGSLSSVPGLTHQTRALYSLMMCSRWGTDLGPVDRGLYDSLRALIGLELSFLCDYVGVAARVIATVIPAVPTSDLQITKTISFHSSWSNDLGRKGKKDGIRLAIDMAEDVKGGVKLEGLQSLFEKVGKGLHLGWKVEAIVR